MTQIPLQSRFKQDFARLRFGTGSYVNGRYSNGSVTSTAFKGSVQPFNDRGSEALQPLKEGERTKKFIVIYTYPDTLRTASEKPNSTKADLVYYEGEVFEVQKVNRWKGQILTHDEVWAWECDPGDLYPGETQPSGTSNVAANGTSVSIYGLGNYLTGTASLGLVVTVNAVSVPYTAATISGSYADKITLTLNTPVSYGASVGFNYSSTTGNLASVLTGVVPTTSGSITNLVPAPPP